MTLCYNVPRSVRLLKQNSKSKEVLQFVHDYEYSRVSVFWIHAGNKIQFEQDYRKLYQLIKPPKQEEPVGDIRPIVKDWLESPESGDWILVLDNADDKLDFFPVQNISLGQSDGLAKFIPNNPNGTVIVTTRDRDVADQLANRNVLHKEPMDLEEAGLLYFTYYPEAAEFTYDESILQLLNELHYIPLAIVHAASYLRLNPSTSPSRYLELLSSARDEQLRLLEPRKIGTFQQRYLSKPHNDVRRDASAGIVRATVSITFRQVDEQSPLASSLLKLMASVDYRSIPHELLARSELENSNNETALGEALNKLISYSLLVCTDSDDGKTYEMHPSIHQSGKESLSALEMATTVQRTAGALHGIISKSNFTMGNWSMWRVYLAHISALSRNVKTESVQTARIHHYMSEYLLFVGRYHEAEDPCRRSAKLFTKFLGQEHPDTLTSIYNLAMIYQFQRQWKEAEEISVQLVETTKRVLGQEHSHTLTRMGNLASIYYMQGRMKEAEELEVHVVETSKRVLGLEDPLTLMSMNELALIYSHLGQLKKAEDLEVLAVETSKKVLGVGHQNTLFCMGNLASIYQSQERWKEAEELLVQVIEMNKKVLGVKHPNTLNNMANLAWTYRSQQRWKEAEELYVQVIETSKKVLGIEHPNTLNYMNNLAFTYWGQGQWKEAEELFGQVTETSKKVLGVEHPDTLNSMNNLAFAYWRQGRWKDAEELYGQVIEKSKNVRGVEHPNTLNSMNNLASTYRSQERWKEAEELEVQVIETSKKVLGVEHPNTLNYMNNLAYTYWRQGRWKEAEEQYFQVLETTKTVHSQEHPQTLISMVNLATAHMNNGRWKEAEELIETVMHTRKKLLGLEHPDTLTAMNILAYVYMSQGRINEAQIVMAETATLRSRVLGKDHPDTKYSMDTLLSWKDKSRFGGN